MRLFEAILEANHRAVGGDSKAGIHPDDFANELPVVALTCIDPRLNHLFPEVMGIHEDQFIWLRNAGNIIFDPMSSMTRTLALACAVKGGREIAIIGHTDCKVGQTNMSALIDRFKAIGIDRSKLPDDLMGFFGMFASERQNVIRGVDFVRSSPLIGPNIPVHGLVVDVNTGRLEWIVNGYDVVARGTVPAQAIPQPEQGLKDFASLMPFKIPDFKMPDVKIGEVATEVIELAAQAQQVAQDVAKEAKKIHLVRKAPEIPTPPRIPITPTPRVRR
jgi:carbonic anhydrase